jgi:hypothetical protein
MQPTLYNEISDRINKLKEERDEYHKGFLEALDEKYAEINKIKKNSIDYEILEKILDNPILSLIDSILASSLSKRFSSDASRTDCLKPYLRKLKPCLPKPMIKTTTADRTAASMRAIATGGKLIIILSKTSHAVILHLT